MYLTGIKRKDNRKKINAYHNNEVKQTTLNITVTFFGYRNIF